MCQIEKFGASPFRYVRTDIEVHGEERVLTVHNRVAIPIITKRFACYDTPSFYSPVRKEPRDKKQKNRKIQDRQGQAHDRAPKKRSQERESETIIRKSKCSTDFKRNDFLKKTKRTHWVRFVHLNSLIESCVFLYLWNSPFDTFL